MQKIVPAAQRAIFNGSLFNTLSPPKLSALILPVCRNRRCFGQPDDLLRS
jgi:hypothetical protein